MKLRYYQEEAIEAVFNYWNKDNLPPLASPLVQVPTGGGKSAIIGGTIRRLVEDYGCRVVLATHRSELIEQDAHDLREIWPQAPIGIFSAGLNSRDGTADIVIAGVQTVHSKTKLLGHRDVIIVDEAHLISPDDGTQYQNLINGIRDMNPDARLVL